MPAKVDRLYPSLRRSATTRNQSIVTVTVGSLVMASVSFPLVATQLQMYARANCNICSYTCRQKEKPVLRAVLKVATPPTLPRGNHAGLSRLPFRLWLKISLIAPKGSPRVGGSPVSTRKWALYSMEAAGFEPATQWFYRLSYACHY